MSDILELFFSFLMYPSFAFGFLIGAGVGSIVSYTYFGSFEFIVVAIIAGVCGVLNRGLFSYLEKRK